jgi:antitoxin component of RelBE/YafQ-DinJ toxin-antitoxin module
MPQRVTIWWTDEQARVVKMRASEYGLTVSQLLRVILDKELQTGGAPIEQGWRAGFAHGYNMIMQAMQSAAKDLERRMMAGEFEIGPPETVPYEPVDMNG